MYIYIYMCRGARERRASCAPSLARAHPEIHERVRVGCIEGASKRSAARVFASLSVQVESGCGNEQLHIVRNTRNTQASRFQLRMLAIRHHAHLSVEGAGRNADKCSK